MSGSTPLEYTSSIRVSERIAPKPPEVKPTEVKIGPEEQGIIARIDQDGDIRKVFEDIADGKIQTPSAEPQKPHLWLINKKQYYKKDYEKLEINFGELLKNYRLKNLVS